MPAHLYFYGGVLLTIENLEVGMVVPNYKKFCELLGEPIKNGDSKAAQMKKWNQFFGYEKNKGKNSFSITAVYDTPQLQADGRAKYAHYIKSILLDFLSNYGGIHETSLQDWFSSLGMVNEAFFNENAQQQFLEKYYAPTLSGDDYLVSSVSLQKVVTHVRERLKRMFFSALDALQKDQLAKYTVNFYIVDTNGSRHIATTEERHQIDTIEQQVLQELGYKTKQGLYSSKKNSLLFRTQVREKIHKKYGWTNYYNLVLIESEAATRFDYKATDSDQLKHTLNRMLCKNILNQLILHKSSSDRKVIEDWAAEKEKIFVLPPFFKGEASLIVEELMAL